MPTSDPTPLIVLMDQWANVLTHAAGGVWVLYGFVNFLLKIWHHPRRPRLAFACLMYTLTLCVMYGGSTAYHLLISWRYVLLVDQVGVFIAIGGITTSYALLAKSHWHPWQYLIIWAGVIAASAVQVAVRGNAEFVTVLAAPLGGISILCLSQDPAPGRRWLWWGAFAYVAGLPFLAFSHVPFAHAAWHSCTLLGNFLDYLALREAAPKKRRRLTERSFEIPIAETATA